ncbi:MAG: hypothetical protein IH886_17200 [Nitrospinae bacterium]|nr:hypothetical protein [Nitrospinota bacterium]
MKTDKRRNKNLSALEKIFPVTWVKNFSSDKKIKVYGIFIVSMFLSFLGEYINPSESQPYPFGEFIKHSSQAMIILKEIGEFVYSRFGKLITINSLYFFYLLILYFFVNLKKEIKYSQFILPFLFLSFMGILHGIFKVTTSSYFLPVFIYQFLFGYILIFYLFLLFRVYKINIIRCFLIVSIPFSLIGLFFGMAFIAPYLV